MYLIKLTLLASFASVAFGGACVRHAEECPPDTHAKHEPKFCGMMGYPQEFRVLCVDNYDARLGSLDRWLPQGSSRRTWLREAMCQGPGNSCDPYNVCCRGDCSEDGTCILP